MNITEVIEAFVYVVVVLLSVFVIPVIKNKYSAQELDKVLKWVDIAVAAAEQLYDVTDGPIKKKYVLNYLSTKGFVVDEDELDLAIEASVNRLHAELYGVVSYE